MRPLRLQTKSSHALPRQSDIKYVPCSAWRLGPAR